MQRPTDTLRADHAITALGLGVLRAIADHVRARQRFPSADVAVLLRFLREYLLAVHLRKESEVVCPAVAMCGDEHAATLVGDLLRTHDEISDLLHSLILFWEPADDLTPAEQDGFADTVDTLASRITRMQEHEEQRLFVLCDTTVPADDLLGWQQQFTEFERERGEAAVWKSRLEELARRWLPN